MSGEGRPLGLSRLSEAPSLLDFHNTLGNDSVLQYALHQFLNGSHWYSVFEIGCSNTFNPFLPIVLNTGCYSCMLLRGTEFEGNRSSPLYAICLNWLNRLQCVGFDSNYSFTDVTVKSNRTGNIPRQVRGIGVTSLYAFDQSRFGVLHYSHRSPTHKYLRSSHF